MYSKILTIILALSLLLCFSNIFKGKDLTNEDIKYTYNNDVPTINEQDILPPNVKNISPGKCQQYIVSKPTIKINYNDESGIDTSSVKLYVNYNDVTKKCTISNHTIIYTPDKKFKRGNQIVKLEVSDLSKNKNNTTFEWYFTVGTPVYTHYYGLLHSHTSASDGHGTYDDAYYMARDKANLDFFAITEHSNMLDNNLNCSIEDASSSKKWNELIKAKDKFNSNGNFTALNGFEMTYPHNSKDPIGHINIFNSNGFVTEKHPNMTLENFYKLIYDQGDLIGQFNHPCDKFGKFDNLKYSPYGDEVISLIEVGNGYNKNLSKNIISHDMYQLALDNGWHVAPTCNQDNHRIDFGVANEFRTVILSTDLTKDALFDSLKKMRVYATQDKNIKIDYTINNLPLGSTISKTSKLNFSISAIDKDFDDKIEEIQVVSNNGEIINSKKFNSNLAKLDFNLKPTKNKFYYVKVIQNNEKVSVTAPIWVK
ncbi:CehA/McbA family metallohydrolase [Clostridium sp. CCUG 7971]|uniref:CehA/McbA family metallohydrolase n=1 Tax=Clostridium sp. CCUG 7971 TaxID=2811414 RepID=UPI001ABB4A97|nr:CehA/McbA family metallohydrolase [Clostridium sp. CCUG 7971]MBO3446148.1 CehA/McbA family metallohydrolase [Clostridium sp. CCUG 7971]